MDRGRRLCHDYVMIGPYIYILRKHEAAKDDILPKTNMAPAPKNGCFKDDVLFNDAIFFGAGLLVSRRLPILLDKAAIGSELYSHHGRDLVFLARRLKKMP